MTVSPMPAAARPSSRCSRTTTPPRRRIRTGRNRRESCQGRDPYLDEHDQRRALQAAGARRTRRPDSAILPRRYSGAHRWRPRPSFSLSPRAMRTITVCQPLFDAVGQKTLVIGGEPSAANLVKLSGNFLQAAAIEALGEAIALIGKAGIDRRAYVDLLTSSVFNLPVYKIFGGLIAERKFEPAGFALPLGYKDIRLALAAKPRSCACPCRSGACCTTGFCGCLRRAAATWIGPRSGSLRRRMPAPPQFKNSSVSRSAGPTRSSCSALLILLIGPLAALRMPVDIFPSIAFRSSAWSGSTRACRPTRWRGASSRRSSAR
jgi:hypothetical protein